MAGTGPRAFHKFDPPRAARLVAPERASLHPPEVVLHLLDPRPGEVVGDLGCGPGFFTVPLAQRVQPGGRVLACDLSPEMLGLLRSRVADAGVGNVEAAWSGESSLPWADGACDRVLLACLLHELVDPGLFLAEVRRVLRPGGRGLAVDWLPLETGGGPPLEARVPPAQAAAWLEAACLSAHPPVPFGPSGYAVVFTRPVHGLEVRDDTWVCP